MNYNLVDEEWIPVLYRDGTWKRVGIRTAFEDAHRIRGIAAPNPMDRIAIVRFLLALLYWTEGSPPEGANRRARGLLTEQGVARIEEHRDCFNLLGDERRFFQDRAAQRRCPATDLIQEVPTGNNFWHFRHSTDERDGLCPACCALGLLRLPLYAVSGLPDLKAGISGTPPIYVVPWGETLEATLQLNWIPQDELGIPAWVRPDVRPTPGEDVPILTGLTLLARRVLLHEPAGRTLACIGCGTITQNPILTCEFQTAGPQKNDRWHDAHVVYLAGKTRKSLQARDLRTAERFRMDKPWTDLLARMIEARGESGEGNPRRFLAVGFATNKALSVDVWERIIDVPSTTATPEAVAALLRNWEKETPKVKRADGVPEKAATAVIAAIRPAVEDRVSAKAQELLSGNEAAWREAAEEYQPFLHMTASALVPGCTATAVENRANISKSRPDLRQKTPRKRKGETR